MNTWRRKREQQNIFAGSAIALETGVACASTLLHASGEPQSTFRTAGVANLTFHGTFLCVCIVCGAVTKRFEPRAILSVASVGFAAYISTLWIHQIHGHIALLILGAILRGTCSAISWTCSTFISYAYASNRLKGRYIATNLATVSMVSTIANLVALGLSFDRRSWQMMTTPVYTTLIIATLAATLLAAFAIVPMEKVLPSVPRPGYTSLLMLILPCFASEMPTVAISIANESYFGARTRAINSLLYAAAQTTGTLLLLATLDYKGSGDFRRHQIIVVAGVAFCTTLCWVTFLVWNYRYADENGLQDWDFPGYTLACMSMILHGLNSGVYRIVTQYFVSKACQRQESTASFSAITCAAIGAGLLFASGIAASGLGEIVSNGICFAVQGSGVLAMAFAASE